jgi:hypothetical protein
LREKLVFHTLELLAKPLFVVSGMTLGFPETKMPHTTQAKCKTKEQEENVVRLKKSDFPEK